MKNVGKALILGLSLAGGGLLVPLVGSAAVGIDITVAPPAPRVEVVPAPRPGYVWAPGYWEWRQGAHVWVGGRWMGARPGYRWVPDRWEQHGDHWHHAQGHWEH
jgi:WXXGXW repeat (2 copies)